MDRVDGNHQGVGLAEIFDNQVIIQLVPGFSFANEILPDFKGIDLFEQFSPGRIIRGEVLIGNFSGPGGDPVGNDFSGRAAICGVIFEPAVFQWVMAAPIGARSYRECARLRNIA